MSPMGPPSRVALLAALLASACVEQPDEPECIVDPNAKAELLSCLPKGARVMLGDKQVTVLEWSPNRIRVHIPEDAPIGDTKLTVYIGDKQIGSAPFAVASKKDTDLHDPDAVALDPDERQYVEAILKELRNLAQRDQVPELDEFAHKLEQLLEKAENGEITKQQLLEELAKAENALNKGGEPDPAEVQKQLGEMGKELTKEQLTKQLGDALQKNDMQKAKEELEKLADKLDKKELNDKQKEDLAKQLQKAAEQMEKSEQERQKKADDKQQKLQDQIEKMEKEIRRLEQQKDQKSQQQKEEMERRLREKKRELEKLQKEEQEKRESEQRRAVKRLQKDMEKAAENLQKPKQDQQGQEQDNEQQASRNLKDAARETGRVDQDQRKQATQKKMSSQMDDLREAMRRAKQRGNKGPNDPFNKNGKNQDFIARARGQKGQGQAWKPGQGQGQGQGQGKGQGQGQNGQGNGSGGSTWGTGTDGNLAGDPTGKTGNTKDQDLQGKQGQDGGSVRETILAAAQKGFASKRYQKVYQDYQRIVEEVMRNEKLPSSYKYYVKRYFAKIHPSMDSNQ
jgi:chemotaxis protein histidine kinase CheA